jgi:hypothetical protein
MRRDELGCPIDPEALWEAVEVREPDAPASG